MKRQSHSPIGQPQAVQRPETVRLYAADWLAFISWCRAARRSSLPADGETLTAYLLATAAGTSRGTVGRKRAAIRAMHRQNGLPPPALNPSARAALRTVAAPRTVTPSPVTARRPALHRQLAANCPRDLAGTRDRALLLLVASEQVTAEEVLALECEQVRFTDAGAELRLNRLAPALVLIPRGALSACPVRALEEWLQSSETRFGPVFRKVDRWGNVEHARLGPDGVRRIVARRRASG